MIHESGLGGVPEELPPEHNTEPTIAEQFNAYLTAIYDTQHDVLRRVSSPETYDGLLAMRAIGAAVLQVDPETSVREVLRDFTGQLNGEPTDEDTIEPAIEELVRREKSLENVGLNFLMGMLPDYTDDTRTELGLRS